MALKIEFPVLKSAGLRGAREVGTRQLTEVTLKKACYAPEFWCVTHKCPIDACWTAGRCNAAYALNK